jgi:hypothetical protein
MRIVRASLVVVCLTALGTTVQAKAEFEFQGVGGFALAPDNVTLAVGLTAKPELVYIDTTAGKELRRVAIEFQPGPMAWQDKFLFVCQKAGGVVHILEAGTGKEVATAKVGSTVRTLACHPRHGLAFATNIKGELWMLNAKGRSMHIKAAKAHVAAMDPSDGKSLYTLYEGRIRTDLTKLAVLPNGVKFGPTLQRACGRNLYGVFVTGDGKQVGASCGGGYDEAGSGRRHYAIPLYSTADMKTMLGEIVPNGLMAAHPVLPLAAVVRMNAPPNSEGYCHILNTSTYAEVSKHPLGKRGGNPMVLTFGGKGRKLVCGLDRGKGVTSLQIMDLTLTRAQEEAIEKAFPK